MIDSSPSDAAGIDAIARRVSADSLDTSPQARNAVSADLYSRGATCAAVFRPADTDELAAGVAAAAEAGYAVIARGGGLTYTGGYVPESEATIVVDLGRLNRVIAFSAEDLYVTAEAGCTWKQLYETLAPHGLRLPFFGTFSGAGATVGGGLSSGAMFFGSARHGMAADNLLALDVVLADGTLLRTGQGAIAKAPNPAYRSYGPDLTGLFVHDGGAFGIKAAATFRLIRAPAHTGYASFAFDTLDAAAAALSEIARTGAAEEVYAFDAESTRNSLDSVTIERALETAAGVVRQSGGLLRGAAAAVRMASGMGKLRGEICSLHLTCAANSAAALEADLAACAAAASAAGGRALPDTIPRAARAGLFPPLNGVLGPQGQRWAAVNCKVPHSGAPALLAGIDALLAAYRPRLEPAGVRVAQLLSALGGYSFSYEAVLHWNDEWLPLHESAPEPSHLRGLPGPAANPEARALVHELRTRIVDLFTEHGAASNQIGRAYPYLELMRDEPRKLLLEIKRLLDAHGRMNPGVLGLR